MNCTLAVHPELAREREKGTNKMYTRHMIKTDAQIACKWREVQRLWNRPGGWVMTLERCVECGDESISFYQKGSSLAERVLEYCVSEADVEWVQSTLWDWDNEV